MCIVLRLFESVILIYYCYINSGVDFLVVVYFEEFLVIIQWVLSTVLVLYQYYLGMFDSEDFSFMIN